MKYFLIVLIALFSCIFSYFWSNKKEMEFLCSSILVNDSISSVDIKIGERKIRKSIAPGGAIILHSGATFGRYTCFIEVNEMGRVKSSKFIFAP